MIVNGIVGGIIHPCCAIHDLNLSNTINLLNCLVTVASAFPTFTSPSATRAINIRPLFPLQFRVSERIFHKFIISNTSPVACSDIDQNLCSDKRMENLPYEKEVSSPPLERREETPERAMAMVEPENVLTEKNGGQQNIVARRNNKDDGNKVTPPNVKVPPKKLFGFPERYRSPTDSIMSPTSRGLLARNRKSVRPVEIPTYLPRKSA